MHLYSLERTVPSARWDWVQATPDRNTGLWDAVTLETTFDVVITDPIVRTVSVSTLSKGGVLDGDGYGNGAVSSSSSSSSSSSAVIVPAAMLTNRGPSATTGTLRFDLNGGAHSAVTGDTTTSHALAAIQVTLQPNETVEVSVGDVTVNNVTLWWPHTHASGPYLCVIPLCYQDVKRIALKGVACFS
jgi:mannosylglycoprotein endo-beta-mannosidase